MECKGLEAAESGSLRAVALSHENSRNMMHTICLFHIVLFLRTCRSSRLAAKEDLMIFINGTINENISHFSIFKIEGSAVFAHA
jgi:hypothetical protein